MSGRTKRILAAGAAALLAGVLWLLWGKPAARAIVHARDGSHMVALPVSEFRMGTSEAHPDLPKQPLRGGGKGLKPNQVLLARADRDWRNADERPVHRVKLSAFAIDRYEVTNAQYRAFRESIHESNDHAACHRDEPKDKDHSPRYWGAYNPLLDRGAEYGKTTPFDYETFIADDLPVVGVDWYDAHAYCQWVGKRLPTEAEWERAACAQDRRRWPWGNEWQWGLANIGGEKLGRDVARKGYGGHEKDGFIYAAPVGSFPAGRSPEGIDDLAGNVAEWCSDWYAPDTYAQGTQVDPQGPDSGSARVVRGGSSKSSPSSIRGSARASREPLFRNFDLGFRCAKDM